MPQNSCRIKQMKAMKTESKKGKQQESKTSKPGKKGKKDESHRNDPVKPFSSLTKEEIAILKEEYAKNPWLQRVVRKQLARRLNLTEQQVSFWFASRKRKIASGDNQP